MPYGDPSNSPVKADFLAYWNMLNPLLDGKEVIVTEEGWPSGGTTYGQSVPDGQSAQDYFHYWYSRWQIFPTSYYFALYDRFPGLGMESYWGIFAPDRTNSLLDGDHSKSIDKSLGHAIVSMTNQIGTSGQKPKPRDASIYACLGEYGKGDCYPIYGYPNFYLGDIRSQDTKKIMFDTSGDYYKSLLVKYYDDAGAGVNFCYISSSTLKTLAAESNSNPETKIILRNKAYDDSCDLTGG